jgi:cytochrome o ubiquinol oxidase subunit 3
MMSELMIEKGTHSEVAETHAAGYDHAHDQARHVDNMKFAMWLYLASEVVIFSTLIAVYILFRIHNPEAVREVQQAAGVGLVSFNTFLLLTSSWAMVMGLRQIQLGNRQGLIRWIGITAVLGAIFVGLQYVEYQNLAHEGITIYSSEYGMRFYAPTAFHGFHVIIGVLWALFVIRQAMRGRYDNGKWLGVEVFGLYWHFVDVVWIFLFTLIYLI